MAVSLNGFFMSLEISASCPALNLNSVALTNIAPDHLLMDKGSVDSSTGTPIVSNNSNLGVDATTGWKPDQY